MPTLDFSALTQRERHALMSELARGCIATDKAARKAPFTATSRDMGVINDELVDLWRDVEEAGVDPRWFG